jgi:hypothetical protein
MEQNPTKSNLLVMSIFMALVIVGIYGYVNVNPIPSMKYKLTEKSATFAAQEENVQVITKSAAMIANQDGTIFTLNSPQNTYWIGNGASKDRSFLGLRFKLNKLPKENTISSAYLELTPSSSTFAPISILVFTEINPRMAVFTKENDISSRTVSDAYVTANYTEQWKLGQKISIGGLNQVISEGLRASKDGDINLIIKGIGSINSKRTIYGALGNSENAPKLVLNVK